jgi:hypothetical protein
MKTKDFTKKLNQVLTLVLTIAALAVGQSAGAQEVASWAALQTMLDNASTNADAPTVITLDCDVVAESGENRLIVTSGRHAIIDLNGHTIDRHLSVATGDGHVFNVRNNASLVIRDSQGGGQITGGYTSATGGGITVSGTLTLEGGTICGNRSNNNGGGLSVSGTFIMTGGTITNNTCNTKGYGSAIYASQGTVRLQGGTITGNYGKNAIYTDRNMTISGTYDVSGNFTEAVEVDPNVAPDIVLYNRVINIAAAISPAHPAIVAFENGSQTVLTSGWSTHMGNTLANDYFTPFSNDRVNFIYNNEVVFATTAQKEEMLSGLYSVTLSDDVTTASPAAIISNKHYYAAGSTVTLSYSNLPMGCKVAYSVNDSPISGNNFCMPAEDVTVTATIQVPYIDAAGTERIKNLSDVTFIESSNNDVALGKTNRENWYAVNGNVTINGYLFFDGTHSHLILCDGATLNVSNEGEPAIHSRSGDITFYAQTLGTGTVNAIGFNGIHANSNVTINGGIINATGTGSAAILGHSPHDIIINRGTVTASGYYGINQFTNVTINGGNVTACGSNGFHGIHGYNATITINGGNVNATSTDGHGIYAKNNTTVTLGWSTPDDRITASSIYLYTNNGNPGTVRIADGQILTDGTNYYSGTLTDTQISAIAGKTLQPFVPTGVTLEKVGGGWTVTLDDSSTGTVNIPTNITVDNVSLSRTFTASEAATLMLPFAIDVANTSGAAFYTYTGVTYDTNTNKWKATMTQVTSGTIAANTPYVVMPTGDAITFTGSVTLNTTTNSQQTTNGEWTFKGTYEEKTWTAAECGNDYGFAATDGKATDGVTDVNAGDFVKLAAGAHIKPGRSYLTYTGGGNPFAAPKHRAGTELPSSISVILVSANGETTEISDDLRLNDKGQMTNDNYYDLQGRKIEKPTKGLYIVNGRKVVVK